MLKVAYHRPMSSPWVVRGAWALMNSNTSCHGNKKRRETVEDLGNDEPQVGVVNWVIVLLTI